MLSIETKEVVVADYDASITLTNGGDSGFGQYWAGGGTVS